MKNITIRIPRDEVYDEVAKATDYTGSKLTTEEENLRDRILMTDADLKELGRFWDESVIAVNERLKEMLLSGHTEGSASGTHAYVATLETSNHFEGALQASVESAIKSFFIASMIAQWFKFSNKEEAADYFSQAAEQLVCAERMLYSRRRPGRPSASGREITNDISTYSNE